MWADAQETDELLSPAPRQAVAGREPPTRSESPTGDEDAVGCPALAHMAFGISCVGLLLSIVHLCVDIHEDAVESASASGYKRGRAAAYAWPGRRGDQWQTARGVPASWATCSDVAQSRELKMRLNWSDTALQVSSPISYNQERERRWAAIMASLRNTTARVAKMHPGVASPLDHVIRMQREHEEGIGRIAQILQRIEHQQERWQLAGESDSDGTHVEKMEDEQHAHQQYARPQHTRAIKFPGPVADSNATSFRRSPELAGEGEGSDKEETIEEILDALRYSTAKDAASALKLPAPARAQSIRAALVCPGIDALTLESSSI